MKFTSKKEHKTADFSNSNEHPPALKEIIKAYLVLGWKLYFSHSLFQFAIARANALYLCLGILVIQAQQNSAPESDKRPRFYPGKKTHMTMQKSGCIKLKN